MLRLPPPPSPPLGIGALGETRLLSFKATEVDDACGAILEELRRQDVLDNTVVIFTTDNGNFHGEVSERTLRNWHTHRNITTMKLINCPPHNTHTADDDDPKTP